MFPTLVSTELFSHFLCAVIVQPQQCVGSFVPLRPPLDILLAIVKNVLAPRVNITWINRAVDSLLAPCCKAITSSETLQKAGITHHSSTTEPPLTSTKFWWPSPLWKNLCAHWIVVDIDKSTSRLEYNRVLVSYLKMSSFSDINTPQIVIFLWSIYGWLGD